MKKENPIRLSPRVVGLCLFLGAVLLATVILNLPASAEPPEPTPTVYPQPTAAPTLAVEPDYAYLDTSEIVWKSPVRLPSAARGWTPIMTEDFEGTFPDGKWTLLGDPGWSRETYRWHGAWWSGYCAGGGTNGVYPPGPYPNNMSAWMIYGPFDLSTATDAELRFYYWLQSEAGYDYFKYYASIDGTNFYGFRTSGDISDWRFGKLELNCVPGLGDVTGQSSVWIAFKFDSDSSVAYEGAYVDDIELGAVIDGWPAETVYKTDCDNEKNAPHTGEPDWDMFAPVQCMFRDNALHPIEFNIVVPSPLPSFTTAQLNLYVWDVDEQDPDCPERDEVYFNETQVGYLTGANDVWSTTVLDIPKGLVQQGNNLVEIHINTTGCLYQGRERWCTGVDWAELVLDGGGGTAFIRSWAPLRDCWWPGSTQAVLVEVDTSLSSQEVTVEVNVLDPRFLPPYNLVGASQTDTIHGTQDDEFIFNLDIPPDAMTGDYILQVIVYDTSSYTQNDYDEKTIRIDPTCGTPTPVVPLTVECGADPEVTKVGHTVSFTSTVSGGTPPYSYSWDFDDGGTSDLQNPTHTYTATGTYHACVTVTDYLENEEECCVDITVESETQIWKEGGWIDYAPSGMPDFDQRQDLWDNPKGSGVWSYCGPVAVANCLWWFDSKFEPNPVPPPTINDNYPLVQSYSPGQWDDHNPLNLIPFVDDLAWRMDCDGQRTGGTWSGTYVDDMYAAILQYLADRELDDNYAVMMVEKPTFDWVAAEVEKCEDVILLLGFWTWDYEMGWERVGGHYVTTAGVDWVNRNIAFSNPIKDSAESGWPGRVLDGTIITHDHSGEDPNNRTVHNDAGNISHDIYDVVSTDSPGGTWGLADYAISYQQIKNFFGQNFPRDLPQEFKPKRERRAYAGAEIQTEVEYAIAISPIENPPCTVDGDKTANPDQVEAGDEVTVILTLHGRGDCPTIEEHADVMLVIDRSGSMDDDGWDPTIGDYQPIGDAKIAAKTFVDMLNLSPGADQVGLVSYASSATLDWPLSRSAADVRTAIEGLSASGRTNIADGINKAQEELESVHHDPNNTPVIILMSDGKHNEPPDTSPGPAADAAKAKGTRIITIGLGTDVDEAELRGLASSLGDYYYAPTRSELEYIYQQIAGSIIGAPATNITLVDKLSCEVTLVPGSFTGSPLPTVTDKTLTWNIPLLRRGQTKTFSYRVKTSPTAEGQVCLNESTKATYTDSNGYLATLTYDPACVTVKPQLHDSYCKDHDTDDGSVPSNPNGEAWWESPDIWVRHQQDGVREHQNPKGCQINYVYATVRNRGNTTMTNIEVDLYWAVGAAAIPWPGGWTKIGTATIPSLPPWSTATINLPWHPLESGHYCFLARIHSAQDLVKHEGLVPFDNNLCQRNVQVLDPEETEHDNPIIIGNPYSDTVHTDVEFDSDQYPIDGSAVVTMDQATFDKWQDAGGDLDGGEVITGTSSVSLDVSPHSSASVLSASTSVWPSYLFHLGSSSYSSASALSASTGRIAACIGRIPLGANEEITMTISLEVPPESAPELGVRQKIDGEDVGGSTYGPPTPFHIYLPLILRNYP